MYVDNTHSVFMDILKNLNNVCNYLWKMEFWVLGDKIGNITNLICSLCRTCNVWRFSIAFHFRTEDSSSLPAFAVFLPKMAKHDVTKTQFSRKILDWIFWTFGGNRQIDAGEGTVLKVSRRYLPPVFSYRENPAGGRICPPPPPPPAGCVLTNVANFFKKHQLCAKNSHVWN